MNKYDERYDIRLAKTHEIPEIMQFIHDYWDKSHILAHDRVLFDYQYGTDTDDVYVVIAKDRNTNLIEAILGLIECSHTENTEKKDIWGALWKVCPEHNNMPFLGVELMKRLHDLIQFRAFIGSGANPETTVQLRKRMFKDYVEKMKHYYILNPQMVDFRIAHIAEKKIAERDFFCKTHMVRLYNIQEVIEWIDIDQIESIPYKDSWYFDKRYYKHPYYEYLVFGLSEDLTNKRAIFVLREVNVGGAKAVRIVDYIGEQEALSGIKDGLIDFLITMDYEYVDFYCTGFDEAYINKSGFILREADDVNIIPNYFEPFVQKNIDIWVHFNLMGTTVFKADGDQDRPNVIKDI